MLLSVVGSGEYERGSLCESGGHFLSVVYNLSQPLDIRGPQLMENAWPNSIAAQPSRPADLRQTNCRVLLRLLRANASCSKADLARLSGLSVPTVSSAMQDLERVGLVEVVGEGESSGGRPPEMLRFHAKHGYLAAADIGGTRLRMMLSDLGGEPVARWNATLDPDAKDPVSVCRLMRTGLRAMCAEIGVNEQRVLHLTAGAPGITDVDRGIVLSAPNLTDWINVPLSELAQEQLGIPAVAENDTNLAAVGEHWRGAARGVRDFVFIALGTGVGSGVFLGGKLHHGATWSAGEIGYFGVSGMTREPLMMQRTGQLERTIGGDGIEQRWIEQLARAGREDARLKSLRGAQIFDLANDGDTDAKEVLQFTAGVLADAVATITLLLNPQLIVLGGGVGSHECLRQETERVLSGSDFPHPALRTSELGTQAQLYGAISVSLSAIENKLLCQ
jgi:glucokinase